MMKKSIFAACMALIISPVPSAQAQEPGVWDKERFQVRVRAIGVLPAEDDNNVNIGGDADVGDALTPEIDVTYFFTDRIAMELIAATAQHELDYSNGNNLGNTWILPPTLTLQYHHTPQNDFSPYIGAGVNYSMFYGEESGTGFTDLDVDGGFGFALQAGADLWLTEHWGLNVDAKKIWLDVDAELNNGNIQADVDLDPWILGAGVSYRF